MIFFKYVEYTVVWSISQVQEARQSVGRVLI